MDWGEERSSSTRSPAVFGDLGTNLDRPCQVGMEMEMEDSTCVFEKNVNSIFFFLDLAVD